MKRFLIVFALFQGVLNPLAAWAQNTHTGTLGQNAPTEQNSAVKLVTYTDFPPFITDTLPGGGFVNEIVLASFKAANIELDVHHIPWKRSYRAVARGDFLVSHVWAYSEERAQDFHFSAPLFSVANRLMTTLDHLTRWQDLKTGPERDNPVILCTPIGWKVAAELEEMIDGGLVRMIAPSQPASCMELMRAQRTDLIYMPQITASYYLDAIRNAEKDHPTRPWPRINAVDVPSGKANTQHVIFTKTSAGLALRNRFNEGLGAIIRDGTYHSILDRFLARFEPEERQRIMRDQMNAGIIPSKK